MKLDIAKTDFSRLVSILKRLSALDRKRQSYRDWAAQTIKTLRAGRLESWDLIEFASEAFDAELQGLEHLGSKRGYALAWLDLVAEMDALGLRSEKLARAAALVDKLTAAPS